MGSFKERTGGCSKNLGRPVVRGETPIELGDSWFSAKTIEVVRPQWIMFIRSKARSLEAEGLTMNKIKS